MRLHSILAAMFSPKMSPTVAREVHASNALSYEDTLAFFSNRPAGTAVIPDSMKASAAFSSAVNDENRPAGTV